MSEEIPKDYEPVLLPGSWYFHTWLVEECWYFAPIDITFGRYEFTIYSRWGHRCLNWVYTRKVR